MTEAEIKLIQQRAKEIGDELISVLDREPLLTTNRRKTISTTLSGSLGLRT